MKRLKDLPLDMRKKIASALKQCVQNWAKDCKFYTQEADDESEFQPCIFIYKAQGICEGILACMDADAMTELNEFFACFGTFIGDDDFSKKSQEETLQAMYKVLDLKSYEANKTT